MIHPMKSFVCSTIMVSTTIIILTDSVSAKPAVKSSDDPNTPEYWNNLAYEALKRASASASPNMKPAKNVILFLGDGMGVSTITAARTLRRQTEDHVDQLVTDTFPNLALLKTYNLDYQVPDSAGTATAYLTGVKANMGVLGVSGAVARGSADCDLIQRSRVQSVMAHAQRAGKSTGVVTTTSLTDATPAGAYASVSERNFESKITTTDTTGDRCKDIARQLVEEFPGRNLTVALGGGRKHFLPAGVNGGVRADGRNLLEQWRDDQNVSGLSSGEFRLVQTRDELLATVGEGRELPVRKLFGLFATNHLKYEEQRTKTSDGATASIQEPSLTEMTEAAVQILAANPNGFFLLVEGGNIDKAHHANSAYNSLHDTLELNRAISAALNRAEVDLAETLVVVTADHSHGFTQSGYIHRADSVFGLVEDEDRTAHARPTSLLYATGPGNREKANETGEETGAETYVQQSLVKLSSAAHAGEDVAAYATGAMSHLLRATQEQSYVAHLFTYATCTGPYSGEPHCTSFVDDPATGGASLRSISPATLLCLLALCLFVRAH